MKECKKTCNASVFGLIFILLGGIILIMGSMGLVFDQVIDQVKTEIPEGSPVSESVENLHASVNSALLLSLLFVPALFVLFLTLPTTQTNKKPVVRKKVVRKKKEFVLLKGNKNTEDE